MEAEEGDGRPNPSDKGGGGARPAGWFHGPRAVLRWYGRCLSGALRGEADLDEPGFAKPASPRPPAERTTARAQPFHRGRLRPRRWVVAAVVMGGVAAATLVYGGALASIFQGRAERNTLHPPYYSSEGLASIRAGMTESEVRELVGYPLERWWARGMNQTWVYSVPTGRHDYYLYARVTFEVETGRVVSAREDMKRCGPRAVPQGQRGLAVVVGNVVLIRLDDTRRRLKPTDPAAFVFLRGGSDDGRAMTPERVVHELENGGPGMPVECLLIDSHDRLAAEGPFPVDRLFRDSPFRYDDAGPTILGVYHGGCLYGLPPDKLKDGEAQRLEDLKWLLRRLGHG